MRVQKFHQVNFKPIQQNVLKIQLAYYLLTNEKMNFFFVLQGVLEQRCLSGGNNYRVAQIRVVQGLCHTSDGIFQAKPRSSEDFHNFP